MMFEEIKWTNWFDTAQQAYDYALSEIAPNSEDMWEKADGLMSQALLLSGSLSNSGLHVFAEKEFRGASGTVTFDLFDSELPDWAAKAPLQFYLEQINDEVSDLIQPSEPIERSPVPFKSFCDDCSIVIQARLLDLNDLSGELPLSPEEELENAIVSGVLRAIVTHFHYRDYCDEFE
jgi:hypothetical protein